MIHCESSPPPELAKIYDRVKQNFAQNKSDANRIRLVLLLTLPNTSFRDVPSALHLLNEWPRDSKHVNNLQSFRNLLAALLAEQQRLSNNLEEASQKLKEEQKRADTLQNQIDAIKSMEKNLILIRTISNTATKSCPISNPKILIVDDDTDLLELLSIRLTAAGYKVEAVQSAEAALNYLDISRPQLVISDMQMSGMDGMALFEHIHRNLPTLPVIILTAHGTIPDAVAAVQRGVFGYLAKPFDSKTLLANISQALRFVPGGVSQNEVSQASWRRDIITQSAVMEDILTKAGLVAEGDASVLIYGESGVGKGIICSCHT